MKPAPFDYARPASVEDAVLLLAGTAGALFIVNMVLTLLRGRRTEDPALLAPSGVAA